MPHIADAGVVGAPVAAASVVAAARVVGTPRGVVAVAEVHWWGTSRARPLQFSKPAAESWNKTMV